MENKNWGSEADEADEIPLPHIWLQKTTTK